MLFTAEMGTGAHKHMLTDVYLKDPSGKVVLVARKRSMLHQDYTIVDGNEVVAGFIESKVHLGHTSLNVQDANRMPQGTIQVSNFEQKGVPPKCWLEDAGGNTQGSIFFTSGFLGFSGVRLDGSRIFDASFSAMGRAGSMLEELGKRSYSVQLLEPGFSLAALLAVIAAIDHV